MLKQFKLRYAYFIITFIFILAGLICSIIFSKSLSFQFISQYHTWWLNIFFEKFTLLGDGITSVFVVAILFLLKENKAAIVTCIAFISSGLLACLLKNIFSLPRPKLYFQQMHISFSHFIDGVTLSSYSSFPSGHATSAFALATIIVLVYNKRLVNYMVLLLAVMVGFSRIYLGQHFLQDVVAGAFLGEVCAMLTYYFIWQKSAQKFYSYRHKRYLSDKELFPQWN
jgi:membrane-associated phospholipid phosphatase